MDIDSTYSTEKFKHLLYEIEDVEEEKMTPINVDKAVENIRHIAEFLIYGNKNQNSYFELFIERNLMGAFSNILNKG
jgi:hypothetical protein